MENIEALQALERGDKEKVDQNTLRSLNSAQLINLSSVSPVGSSGSELVFAGFTPQGLRLLQENKTSLVSDLERQILNTVVRGFLDHHQPTSKRTLLQRFQSSVSDDLQRLTGRGVLALANNTYPNETYLPKTLAFFHCGDPAALAFAKKSTQIVLRVLPTLFNKDLASDGEAQKQFTPEDVLTEAKAIDSSTEPNAVFTGLYLAQEFSVFSGMRMDARNVGIVSFSLGERVYEERYLDWDERVRQGNIGLIYDQQSQMKRGAVPVSVPSNLELIVAEGLEPYSLQRDNSMPIREQRMNSLAVLISHSSKDHRLASALIDLLRSGLGLLPRQIRCSSVDGYRLPAGVYTDRQLRDEVTASKVLIGLITPNSLASPYVLFELGARWGAGERMIPLLAGVTADQLRGPLSGINVLSCSSEEQLHQTLQEIGSHLGMEVQSPAAYLKQLRAVVEWAENAALHERNFQISMTADGEEPTQTINVEATEVVAISKLGYLLSDETCIVSEGMSLQGTTIQVRLNTDHLSKLFRIHRPDMSSWDHSGPMKFAVTVSIGGETHHYILPARIENVVGKGYKITASKVFANV